MKVPKRNIYQRIKFKKSLEKSSSLQSVESVESSLKKKKKDFKFKRVDPLAKAHLESLEKKRIQLEKQKEIEAEKQIKLEKQLHATKKRALKTSVLNSRNTKGQPRLGKSIEFLLEKIQK